MRSVSNIYYLFIVSFTILLAGCATGYDDSPQPLPSDGGVRIRLGVDNGTRAVQAGEGNESRIDTVTFLFFNEAGESVLRRTFGPSDLADTSAQPYWSTQDIIMFPQSDNEPISKATSLYIVTNHTPSATTKSELRNEILGTETFPQDTNSLFVMEGHRENGAKFNLDNVPLASVQLRRCALKLRLYVTLGEPGKGNLANVLEWGSVPRGRRMNVAMESYIMEPSDPTTMNTLQRSGDSSLSRFYPDSFLPEDIAQHGGMLPNLQGYAYECDWSLEAKQELTIYMNLPYYDKSDPTTEVVHNYYKIHIDPDRLRRNTIYEVRVTVNDLGSPTIDFPSILAQRSITICDWFGKEVDVTITNDQLALYSGHYDMYGENLTFRYRASSQPIGYLVTLHTNPDGSPGYETLPETEATVDLTDYSVGNGTASIWRKGHSRFGLPTPRSFSCYLRVRTIVKPVRIDQYPTSYYGTDNDGNPDYFHIITPIDTPEYPIGFSLEKDYDGLYVNSTQTTANVNVSPDFRIFSKDLTVDGRTFSIQDKVMNPADAVDYCKDLQKATGERWVVPTEREMKLIALACSLPKEEDKVDSQMPVGQYYVARTSSDYRGYVVSIPDGATSETNWNGGSYYIRCVLNVER